MPGWAALAIAITATAVGYAIDAGSGHKELSHAFAGLYIAGCLVAVLAVRQEGLFTAIIQPPLILFCAVPGAYWLFHGRKVGHLKDMLINCGYPLIERFPLMLGTAGAVLLIGLVRWYFGMSNRATLAPKATDDTASATRTDTKSFISGIVAKLNSYLGIDAEDDDADESPDSKRARASTRKSAPKSGRAARGSRSGARATRSRSRHARPSLEDQDERLAERPRRRRQTPPRDFDPADPPRRSRRRPRPEGDPDLRDQSRESRRDSRSRRNPYERPAPRSSRFDAYDGYEPPGTPEHFGRYKPYEPYEPYEPSYEAPRSRRGTGGGSNGTTPTHHPISRVRYRGEGPLEEPRAEPRPERRSRSRAPRRPPAESWE